MPAGSESLKGPRLEFVLQKLPGVVRRTKHTPPPTRREREEDPTLESENMNSAVEVIEPAGYMLYLPTGQAYRLTEEEVVKRGLKREPEMIGFAEANDTKTAMGRFKMARTDAARSEAYAVLQKEVIDACLGKLGNVSALVHGYDPTGKLPDTKKDAA